MTLVCTTYRVYNVHTSSHYLILHYISICRYITCSRIEPHPLGLSHHLPTLLNDDHQLTYFYTFMQYMSAYISCIRYTYDMILVPYCFLLTSFTCPHHYRSLYHILHMANLSHFCIATPGRFVCPSWRRLFPGVNSNSGCLLWHYQIGTIARGRATSRLVMGHHALSTSQGEEEPACRASVTKSLTTAAPRSPLRSTRRDCHKWWTDSSPGLRAIAASRPSFPAATHGWHGQSVPDFSWSANSG